MAGVGDDDWYRASAWDVEAAGAFERRLARSRRGYNRAQYLRIQGSYLVKSADPAVRESGRSLLRRAITEDNADQSNAAFATQQLAWSLVDDQPSEAIDLLREAVQLAHDHTTCATTGTPELDLAEVLVRVGEPEQLAEAVQLLIEVASEVNQQHFLAAPQFRLSLVCARVARRMGIPAAGSFARSALVVAEQGASGAPRHRELGTVEVGPITRAELHEISDAFPHEHDIDDLRQIFSTAL